MSIEFDGYRPGALADIVGMHARYYSENWGFGCSFETKVAREMAEFLERLDVKNDLLLVAYLDGKAVGSIAIDSEKTKMDGVHLRWFIVGEKGANRGLGKQLMAKALAFCKSNDVHRIWLTTFAGLDAARALYEQNGFQLESESEVNQWGGNVREQLFVYDRNAAL